MILHIGSPTIRIIPHTVFKIGNCFADRFSQFSVCYIQIHSSCGNKSPKKHRHNAEPKTNEYNL